jgi:predicted SnoaL-like aldol condensation-catalyzing enzyme
MNDQDAFEYIKGYFHDLFTRRDLTALDRYLDREYCDDDIGDPTVDQIANSKEYLGRLFLEKPTIGVDVIRAVSHGDVIAAFLEWHVREDDVRKVIMKGLANFQLRGNRILKRQTFIYYNEG